LSQQVNNPELPVRTGTLEEPNIRAMEIMDTNQLTSNIKEAMEWDPLAVSILQKLDKTMCPEGGEAVDGTHQFRNQLYVPDQGTLWLQVIHNHHDHPSAGHFGEARTLDLVCWGFHWLGLQKTVMDYVKSCTSCTWAKAPCHRLYGKLKQLLIPSHPWSSISMDFIEQLPKSGGFSAILVIMDRLTKQVIFVPTYDMIDAPGITQIFLAHVFSKHGVPAHVTSDWGSELISHFFWLLGGLLQMHLHFTSGYHPEGDGQTEQANQVLEQYLRVYTNYQQDDWLELLPLAEFVFVYNNATNATTGVSPFFANKGYHLELTPDLQATATSLEAK